MVKNLDEYIDKMLENTYDPTHPTLYEYLKERFYIWCPGGVVESKYPVFYGDFPPTDNLYFIAYKSRYWNSEKDIVEIAKWGCPYVIQLSYPAQLASKELFDTLQDAQILINHKKDIIETYICRDLLPTDFIVQKEI